MLKRTIFTRQFFWAPTNTCLNSCSKKIQFLLKNFGYLYLCIQTKYFDRKSPSQKTIAFRKHRFSYDLILYVPVNICSVMLVPVFPGWTSAKQGLMFLAQRHNAVPPVRLEPATLPPQVKYSTTDPTALLIHHFWKKKSGETLQWKVQVAFKSEVETFKNVQILLVTWYKYFMSLQVQQLGREVEVAKR